MMGQLNRSSSYTRPRSSTTAALALRVEAQEKPSPLPCTDSSPQCIQHLGNLAVDGSLEIRVLDKAIEYQKKKMWSSWLNADGFNPVAVGFRLLRNMIGGGDRAAFSPFRH